MPNSNTIGLEELSMLLVSNENFESLDEARTHLTKSREGVLSFDNERALLFKRVGEDAYQLIQTTCFTLEDLRNNPSRYENLFD
jgi:hypothetical protein